MPNNPEHLFPGVPLLDRADLIRKELSPFGDPWLDPTQIPIHPAVLDSDFLFTAEFGVKVMESLQEAIIEDDRVLTERFGGERALALNDRGIIFNGEVVELGKLIGISVQPNLFWVDITNHANAANVRIDIRNGKVPNLFSNPNHPMPLVKQIAYREDVEEPYMYTWLRNNIANLDLVGSLALRNVAIQVNNLGLQRIGAV